MKYSLMKTKDTIFGFLLFILAIIIYSNSLFGGFIWDDRAAVVRNLDVHGETTYKELFSHDFWGQSIDLKDSHKSYRPLTVISFRINFLLHGLDSIGYHVFNVLLYSLVCILVWIIAYQWMNEDGAKLSAILFLFHPIHVEAVASVVGRADSLCGFFYCVSIIFYTLSIRIDPTNIIKKLDSIFYLVLSILFGVMASLSKEIGITIFLLLPVLDVCEILQNSVSSNDSNNDNTKLLFDSSIEISPSRIPINENKKKEDNQIKKYYLIESFNILMKSILLCFTSFMSLTRIISSLLSLFIFMKYRLQLNGDSKLYNWTILENHISLLPNLKDRILSYAQMQFWYSFKLIYPRHLCFDYGYSCIPVITSFNDWRNVLSFLNYFIIISLIYKSIREMRVVLFISISLILIPISPALNIVFPVGTLLAERLLFIPSIGYCCLVGELLSVDLIKSLQRIYIKIQNLKNNNISNTIKLILSRLMSVFGNKYSKVESINKYKLYILLILLLPIYISFIIIVMYRNLDWKSEMDIYFSALRVCPLSLKARTNYAVLSLSKKNLKEGYESALIGVSIYPNSSAALINLGVAYQRRDLYAKSVLFFEKTLQISENNSKAYSYAGSVLYDWSNRFRSVDNEIQNTLQKQSLKNFLTAINLGFDSPSTLHMSGSLYMELGDVPLGIQYLEGALQKSMNIKEFYKGSSDVPIEDDINIPFTYNQIGNAYRQIGKNEEAIIAFNKGLENQPNTVQILTNLGTLYSDLGRIEEAREVLKRGISLSNDYIPSALLNNLGLLELDHGSPQDAKKLFKKALFMLYYESSAGTKIDGQSTTRDGNSVQVIIQNNLEKAKKKLKS